MKFLYACPECGQQFRAADDAAIHLEDSHCWDHLKALNWLRESVEEEAFYEKP